MTPTLSPLLSSAARELANHLWQSTVFAAAVALLALALRNYQARARYWLWLAASVKFLVPFSLLIAAGSHLAWTTHTPQLQPATYLAIDQISQPFTDAIALTPPSTPAATLPAKSHVPSIPALLASLWLCGCLAVLATSLIQFRRITALVRAATPLHAGREHQTLRRLEATQIRVPHSFRGLIAKRVGYRLRQQTTAVLRPSHQIPIVASPHSLEPGVFGLFHPVLLWPTAISPHLDDAHLEAVLAHELAHIQRRDNLTSALHMLVEAIFWFHPLVWYIERRLVAERERACDQAVLHLCPQPHVYAESILKVCELCLESPLPCVSGITGADLKHRIVQIMTPRAIRNLGLGARLLLFAAALAAVTVPIMLGQMKAAQVAAAVKASAHVEAGVASLVARVWSPIEPQPAAPSSAFIALPALRQFQPSEPVELAQAEAPPPDPSSPHSRLQQITFSAALDGPSRGSSTFPGTIASPYPVYPPEAKAAGIQGVVELNASVTSAGTVANITDVSGPRALRQSAIDAVMQWKFRPLENGESIAGATNFRVLYQLPYQLPGMPPTMGPVPPADEAAAGVKRYGGNITAPLPIYETGPEYTDLARIDKVQGEVTVGLVVDDRGQPQHVQVVRGLGDGLDEKAVVAVRQYKFKPAAENEKPVAVFLYLKVDFRLKDQFPSMPAQMPSGLQREYGILKDGRFHNFLTDIELTIPDGYVFAGCGPSSSNGEQAYLRSQSNPSLAVWMRPVAEPIDGLRAGLREKMMKKPLERSEGWKERPESVQERTFSGKPAISVVADYMQNGKPWVEYLIWINTGKTHTQFYGQAQADQLPVLQQNVDLLANLAVIP